MDNYENVEKYLIDLGFAGHSEPEGRFGFFSLFQVSHFNEFNKFSAVHSKGYVALSVPSVPV
jgi:hypothetical protein